MRVSNGVSMRTGMAFLRNEFYNMSIYRVSFWLNFIYTFLMMYSVGYVWREYPKVCVNLQTDVR